MKSPFRFGARKDPPPPAVPAEAWATLRAAVPRPTPAPEPTPAPAPAEPPPQTPELRIPAPHARISPRAGAAGSPIAYAGPAALSYREIDALENLGRLEEPHVLRLHPSMLSPPPAPLFEEARVPERIVLPHHRVRNRAPATEIFAVPGYELGAHGLLQQAGRVWVSDAVQPAYVNNCAQPDALNLPEIWRGALLNPAAEIIEVDVPVGVVLHPNLVYGHFLLEMLPRLLLLAHLRTLGHAFAVAVPSDAPDWTRDFAALLFGPDETVFYHSKKQRVRAPCFILPSLMNADYHFHPQMNALLESLLARVGGPALPVPRPPRRIYLSRRTFGGWHGLRNEDEVERALEAMGFATVHPQELSFPQQLALYAGADCIVADFGSALHNSLFAPLGCGVVAINWLNRCQSGIAALRAQPLAYLPPLEGFHDAAQPRESDALHTSVDAADLARQVEAFLRFAAD